MKNISAWAIRHPVTPIVLFVVLFFLGTVAFIRLPINLNPDVSFPAVDVNISQPGAAPQGPAPIAPAARPARQISAAERLAQKRREKK